MRTTTLLLTTAIIIFIAGTILYLSKSYNPRKISTFFDVDSNQVSAPNNNTSKRISSFAHQLQAYAAKKDYNTSVCFIADMSLPSGKNRFFVYDLKTDVIKNSGLVAHGSCNTSYLAKARFSNKEGTGCSSLGKYKVECQYKGRFGKAFKLSGLDPSNSNAFKRSIVLHSYQSVPDKEVYPDQICNSLGCPMVSVLFLEKLSKELKDVKKPILLWIID